MIRLSLLFFSFLILIFSSLQAQSVITDEHRDHAHQLIQKAMESDTAWERLIYLADTFGPRFTGSQSLDR